MCPATEYITYVSWNSKRQATDKLLFPAGRKATFTVYFLHEWSCICMHWLYNSQLIREDRGGDSRAGRLNQGGSRGQDYSDSARRRTQVYIPQPVVWCGDVGKWGPQVCISLGLSLLLCWVGDDTKCYSAELLYTLTEQVFEMRLVRLKCPPNGSHFYVVKITC